MPLTYRPRSSSFSDSESQLENIPLAPTDADDSIVLSDLVRTGEASRLRRRGAMRLEHGPTVQVNPPRPLSPTVVVVGSPTWESDPEDRGAGPTFSRSERERNARNSRTSQRDSNETHYILFCGGEETDLEVDDQRCTPYEPSILPLYPPTSSIVSTLAHSIRKKKSNGCGAMLHMHATRQRQNIWLARGEASGAVVSLDASYFDKASSTKIVRSACGCVREGVGCAICGNLLGTRHKPCKTAGDGMSRPKPSGPLHPEGPRYWHSYSHRQSTSVSTHYYVFTFFSSAVSSYPSSPTCRHTPRLHVRTTSSSTVQVPQPPTVIRRDSYDNDNTALRFSNTTFDRVITASPIPLSDVGEDDQLSYQSSFGVDIPPFMQATVQGMNDYGGEQREFDPDGDFAVEPNSPDKTAEVMLFPER